MLQIGLTGGIACGKSNVLRHFDKLGAATIDADQIAREILFPGEPAYVEVVAEFGDSILEPDKTINRTRLGQIVFSDRNALSRLNALTHPHIIAEERRRIDALTEQISSDSAYLVVVDAALMIEVGTYKKYDAVIIAYCPPAIQLQRLLARNAISPEEARQRIQSQMPLLEKVRYADFVVDTTGPVPETFEQVRHIYLELADRSIRGSRQGSPGS